MKFDAASAACQRKHWRAHATASAGLAGSFALAIVAAGVLGGCASSSDETARSDSRLSRPTRKFTTADYGHRVIALGAPVPKGGGGYKVGAPYRMGGKWYVPREQPGYDAVGVASWYGEDFHGRRTANGEIYDVQGLTAAHPTLPLPSYAWVTNQANGRTVLVRINDRGPYARDRVIDLSRAVARELGYEGHGTAQVRVRYAGPAPLDGNDARERQVLAQASWRRGPRLANAAPVHAAAPVLAEATRPRQGLARPPVIEQPRTTASAAFQTTPRSDFGARDDYAALKAQGRVPGAAAQAQTYQPAPPSSAPRDRGREARVPQPPVQQALDEAPADTAPGWSVSGYRQSVSGQRRSLGGP